MKKIIFCLSFFFSLSLFAALPASFGKWEAECSMASLELWNNKPITELAFCSDPKMPMSFRQMPVIVYNYFKSSRKDVQANSLKMLSNYQCENDIACSEYLNTVSTYKSQNKNKSFTILDEIQNKTRASMKIMKDGPKGFCDKAADRVYWTQKMYQIFCPIEAVASSGGELLSKGKTSQEKFEFLLGMYSGQSVLSSSILYGIEHSTQGGKREDCEKPWTMKAQCGGMKEITYVLNCQKQDGKVQCSEKH